MNVKSKMALAVAVVLGSAFGVAQAASQVQGQLNVKIVIGAGCTVSNSSSDGSINAFGDLDFGTHYDLNNTVDGQSTGTAGGPLQVQCTDGTPYTIALDGGQNANGSDRQMADGAGGEFVKYGLYQDAARTQLWGNNDGFGSIVSATGDGTAQDLTVFGRVPNQATPAAGNYDDIVLVTVAW